MKGFKSHHGIRDLLDETVILFNQVIQIFNLEHFNKTDQTGKHRQDVNVLQSGIVGADFIHDDFFRKLVRVDGFFEGGCSASSRCSDSMKSTARYK